MGVNNWLILGFSALSVAVGVLGANIIWGTFLQPWLDKRKYIVYTVDMSLKGEDESMEDFLIRVREQNLGQYEVIKG